MIKTLAKCLIAWLALLGHGAVYALEITQVNHIPQVLNVNDNSAVRIEFQLSDAAYVDINIYDGRNLLVRRIHSTGKLTAGKHQLYWDAKDSYGIVVPAEAYHYTLLATSDAGESVLHDLSELTGGDTIVSQSAQWNATDGRVDYVLQKASRVRIRIGLKNHGPLLRTLLDWVARPAGPNSESWDGWDASQVIDLRAHPQLEFDLVSFPLSANTIIIGPSVNYVPLIAHLNPNSKRTIIHTQRKKKMFDYAGKSILQRKELPLMLAVEAQDNKADEQQSDAGEGAAQEPLSVRLDLPDTDLLRAWGDRFEVVFFVDGLFVYETETGYLPFTWQWDVSTLSPGDHYITANLRGYDGQFGIVSQKYTVAAPVSAPASNLAPDLAEE